MARRTYVFSAILAAAMLIAGGAALVLQRSHQQAAPQPAPVVAQNAADDADRLEAARRDIAHLRMLRRQFRWGIDNLQTNQSYLQVEMERLRHERRVMPADDPARPGLERRLSDLPEQVHDFAETEVRVREKLSHLESELADKEMALKAMEQ